MANNYLLFSTKVLTNLKLEEKVFLERCFGDDPIGLPEEEVPAWEERYELRAIDCQGIWMSGIDSFFDESDCSLTVFSEESGDLEHLLAVLQVFLTKFRPTEHIVIEWAMTCSRPRPGEFGGGVVLITSDYCYASSTDRIGRLLVEAVKDKDEALLEKLTKP